MNMLTETSAEAQSGTVSNGIDVTITCAEHNGAAKMNTISAGTVVAYRKTLTGRTRAGDIVQIALPEETAKPWKVLKAENSSITGIRNLTVEGPIEL